jgi:hypothetical protein
VTVDELLGTVPVPVARGTTTPTGGYSITFTPTTTGDYQVATGDIAQVENTKLSPAYGDLLSPGASKLTSLTVEGGQPSVSFSKVKAKKGKVTVAGSLSAPQASTGAIVYLFAARTSRPAGAGRKGVRLPVGTIARARDKRVGRATIAVGATKFTIKARLKRGYAYILQLEYKKPGQVTTWSRFKTLKVR